MRKPTVNRRISKTNSVPAPTKGWNTLDAISMMDDKYAPILKNFIPTASSVSLRKGSSNHATGMSGRIETLAAYNGATGSKMFAAVNGNIYDVTAAGVVGAPVVTGKTNARWQHTNFATVGGQFMYMVNGVDAPLLYDGTTWTSITAVSSPAITGVTTTNLINVSVFKNRLWFVENNSLRVWYLSADAIGGAANVLDLSGVFPRGGYLVAMGDWTLDAGDGVDDLAVFISSEGEVAVYQGTDPSTAATWALNGIYQVGSPIGRRCLTKFASELLIINQDGLQLMSAALSSSRAYKQQSVTDKIQPTIGQSIQVYGGNYGWETILFPKEDCIFMNVPITGASQQYLMNTRTNGWCQITGWDASCFEVMNDMIYFGTTDKVMKAFDGTSDAGTAINGEALQAFSYMGTSNLKYFQMARPVIASDTSSLGILLGLNVDYDTTPPIGIPTFSTLTVGTWDLGLWDVGVWGGDLQIRKDWQTIGGIGYSGALHMKTQSSTANVQWFSTDYTFQIASGFV
jgi:hypothetical protein